MDNPIFFGRRKGRRLSKISELAIKKGKKYLIQRKDLTKIFNSNNNIILEIGFGDGNNLVKSAKLNSKSLYIGADPFLNTTARCLSNLLLSNIHNVAIWPDDVRKIIKFFPHKSISEIKILFPDPWPKKKHQKRRLLQDEFIEAIYPILKPNGTITIATDHDVLKKWILIKFQRYKKFEWLACSAKDWQFRPPDCFETKYEVKAMLCKRKSSWFVFKKNN